MPSPVPHGWPPITWYLSSKCHHFVYPSPISDDVINVQPLTTKITWCKLKSGIFGYKYGRATKYRCEMGMVTNEITRSDDSGPESTLEVVNIFPGTDERFSGVDTTGTGAVKERKSGGDYW